MTKNTLSCSARLLALAFLFAAGSAMAGATDSGLHAKLRWIPAGDSGRVTLDAASRIALSRSAAESARLQEVGLDFRDVYGVISAETSWVPRTGMGKNGVASHGLGQFEPATARAVGLRNPNDAVEAVHAAARLLREAAAWSAQRIAGLKLAPEQRASKLREGVSIYYNLSSRARSMWSGLNTERLPVETLRHIKNVREGARQADQLNARLGGPDLPPLPAAPAVPVASAKERSTPAPTRVADSKPAVPKAVGTIEWSGQGGEGPNAGRRTYVVMSNGALKAQAGGDAPAGALQWTPRAKG